MGEEEERLITITAHAQCGCGGGGVVLPKCVCVCTCEGGGVKQGVGGCLTPFLLLRPRGSHVVCTVFLHHMTCRFFLFEDFFSSPPFHPLSHPSLLPSLSERRSCQAGKAKQLCRCRAVPH